MSSEPPAPASPGAAFQHRGFVVYQLARFLLIVGLQVQSVAVAWMVYDATRRPLDLGLVGLAQFVPVFALALVGGHAADRYDRRRILVGCYAVFVATGLAFYALARARLPSVAPVYVVLVLFGAARAFAGPAGQALLPQLVPREHFANAVAWSSTIWQVATIGGPALGGALYAATRSAQAVFLAATGFVACALVLLTTIRAAPTAPQAPAPDEPPLTRLLAGVRFVFAHPVILGAISLDLFAVLLGGAVALLPAFARDVLAVGPAGLGALRSAPAAGAALTALVLAFRPLSRRAGVTMLAAVAVFGLATIAFGLSRSFPLSLAALALAGASDMVSVVLRHTVVQLATPDAMRGRVSAVNQVFISVSNELGEFESGLTAAWLGVVPAVVAGGAGTVAVVLLAAWLFPALRRVDRPTSVGREA